MAELARARYRSLFELHVLHHYWLDEGATTFDRITDAKLRTRRLLRYDIRGLFSITPSVPTRSVIEGMGGVFKTTALGLVVALPDEAVVSGDSRFNFFLTPRAAELSNYTALSLHPRQVIELSDPLAKKMIRYKELTPMLSNVTGAVRTWDGKKHLFLSSEYPTDAGVGAEELVADGLQLRQLTSDQPGADYQPLGSLVDLPVFVHQGDAPAIVAPPGVIGAPASGIEMTADTPLDVLAVIRLAAVRGDDDDFSIVDGAGHPKAKAPRFEVHFKNRATTWRYRNKTSGEVMSTEPNPLPLTYFGTTKRKPSVGGITVERDAAPPARVTRLVSEIFI